MRITRREAARTTPPTWDYSLEQEVDLSQMRYSRDPIHVNEYTEYTECHAAVPGGVCLRWHLALTPCPNENNHSWRLGCGKR